MRVCVWYERVAVVHSVVRLDVGVRTGVTVRDWLCVRACGQSFIQFPVFLRGSSQKLLTFLEFLKPKS